jgi:hypothetical protein
MTQLTDEVIDVSLIDRIARHFHLRLGPAPHTGPKVLLLLLVAWVPLVVLSAIHGDLAGHNLRIPLFADYTVWARFVLALPLYVVLEPRVLQAASLMLGQFRNGLVPDEKLASFDALLQRARRARRSLIPELFILAIVVVIAAVEVRGVPEAMSSSWRWTQTGGGLRQTAAGWWCSWVSDSLLLYWMLWMLWWLLSWTGLMAQIAKLDLRLLPTHPDRAGGLGFLGLGHVRLAAIFTPVSLVVSAAVVSLVKYNGATLLAFKVGVGAYLAIAVLLLLAPLLVFVPRLAAARRRGVFEYGGLAGVYVRRFDDKWVHSGRQPSDDLLGSGDVQSLADMGNSYAVVRDMRPMPIEVRDMAGLVARLVLPMLPFVVFVVPLKVIVTKLLQLVR